MSFSSRTGALRPKNTLSRPARWAAVGLAGAALVAVAPMAASAAVAPSAGAAGSVSPASTGWIVVGTFGSFLSCDQFAVENYLPDGIPTRCVEINTGEPYFLWDLEVNLPGN